MNETKIIKELMKDRGGKSGTYSCPVHISTNACLALFQEVGVQPEHKAVGALGDILENFAIKIIKISNSSRMTVSDLEFSLNSFFGDK